LKHELFTFMIDLQWA